jgi:hypothetical protein
MNGWIRLWVVISALLLIVTLFVGYVLQTGKDWQAVAKESYLKSCNCDLYSVKLGTGKFVNDVPRNRAWSDREYYINAKEMLKSKRLADESDFISGDFSVSTLPTISYEELHSIEGFVSSAVKDSTTVISFPYIEDIDQAIFIEKLYFWITALMYWAVASASLLGVGWSIAWIIAGFKTKKIQ